MSSGQWRQIGRAISGNADGFNLCLYYCTSCHRNLTTKAPPMTDPPQQRPTVRLQLRILGEPVAVEAPRPPKRLRLDEVLPLLRDIDDPAVDLAVHTTGATGKAWAGPPGSSSRY